MPRGAVQPGERDGPAVEEAADVSEAGSEASCKRRRPSPPILRGRRILKRTSSSVSVVVWLGRSVIKLSKIRYRVVEVPRDAGRAAEVGGMMCGCSEGGSEMQLAHD